MNRLQTEIRTRLRKVLRDRLTSRHSYSPGSLARVAAWVRDDAATDLQWEALERAGLVELKYSPDSGMTLEDLEGDTFTVSLHEDTVPGGARTILAQQKRFREQVEAEGVWGILGRYRTACGQWETADSIWGIVGDPHDEQEYTRDIKRATIEALQAELTDEALQRQVQRIIAETEGRRAVLALSVQA